MGCIDKLKDSSPELHNYLREQTGIDLNEKTGEGKDEWIKAARDLQDHSARTLNDVYASAGVDGFEKYNPKQTSSEIQTAIDNISDVKSKIYQGVLKSGNKKDISDVLKEVSDQWHDEGTRVQTERDFGLPIVEAAKKLFPQESQESLSTNSMSGLSHSDWFLKNKDKFSESEFNSIKDNLASDKEEEKQKAIDEIIAKKEEVKNSVQEGSTSNEGVNENKQPAEESSFPKPIKPIHEMNSDELDNYANAVRAHNKSLEVKLFGEEGAKKYREAQSISNNYLIHSSDPRYKEANALIDKMEGSLTDSQKNEFYGINAPDGLIYDDSEIRDIGRKVKNVEDAENIDELSSSVKSAVTRINKDRPSNESLAILNAAKKRASELGIDPKELIGQVIKKVGGQYKDIEDAELMMKDAFDKLITQKENINNNKTNEDASTQSSEQQQEIVQQSSEPKHARTESAGSKDPSTETKSSDSNIGSKGQKEKVNEGGAKEPPTETPPIEEVNPKDEEGFASVRKEKLKEIEGAKKIFEKREKIPWNETYQKGLENVQKMYPNKTLYEAMKARVDSFAAKLDAGEIFNPTSEDNAVFTVFRAETDKRIGQIEGLNSDDATERNAALLEAEPLEQDLVNIARVTNPEGEAGRAFNILQSLAKLDPNNGLKLMRMKISRAKGGEPLTPEEQAWTEQKFNEYKEAQRQENAVREQAMKEDFDKKISDLEAQLKDKSKPTVDKTTKEKTLSQSGKDLADKIRKLKIQKGDTAIDVTFGLRNLAVEAVAQLVEQGAKLGDAIKKVLSDDKFKDIPEDYLTGHIVEGLNKKTSEETLDAIKEYAKENDLTDVSKEMVGKNLISDYINSHIGEVDQKDLLNTAAKDLKEVLPDITKKKLIEAYLKEGDYKQETKKQLEDGLQQKKAELKKIAKSELTADQVQKIKLQQTKDQAAKDIKEFDRKIKNGEYVEREKIVLNKKDAELIKILRDKNKIEGQFREKQDELKEKNKSAIEIAADFARSSWIAYLLRKPITLGKILVASVVRPAIEVATKKGLLPVFEKFWPGISKAALSGGESSSYRSMKLGIDAYFKQLGESAIEKKAAKAESRFQQAHKEYEDYKSEYDKIKDSNDKAKLPAMEQKLKKLSQIRDDRMFNTFGNLVYQFLGGKSLKDVLGAFVNRSNEIEKQFGKVRTEHFTNKINEEDLQDVPNTKKALLKHILTEESNNIEYILGFIGRSHSAAKTFSGRYSFASSFMARLEGAYGKGETLDADKVLEIAHESYLDWERGKYQQGNQVSDRFAEWVNKMDAKPGIVGKISKGLLKTEVAIQRVPVNMLWEEVAEFTLGAFTSTYKANKLTSEAKAYLQEEGFIKNSEEFKDALKQRLSKMDSRQAATISRSFRKGGVGIGLYVLAAISGAIHFGIFPHLGQKKKKDEDKLKAGELNPGQVMFGNDRLGETASALISHTPALWPTFMGLGWAQMKHDEILKGKTTPQAAATALYQHISTIWSDIPQTTLVSPIKERTLDPAVSHLIKSFNPHQGFTKKDLNDPTYKYYFDKGIEFTPFNPSQVNITDSKTLSEYPKEKWQDFNEEKKKYLKLELESLHDQEFYVNKEGKVYKNPIDETDPKTLDQLTPEQLKKVISPLEGNATKHAKEVIFPQ